MAASLNRTDRTNAGWALGLGALAIFLSSVSASIVTLALGSMLKTFHASSSDLTWLSIAYLVPYAAVLPAAGKLADVYGERAVLVWSFVLYGAGTLLAAGARDVPSLIALRAVSGLGGAGLTISLGWVARSWAGPRQGVAVGLWRALLLAGTVGGPALGGVMTASIGWRSVLWAPAPLALVGLVLALVYVPRSVATARTSEPRAFDWSGAVATAVGLTALLVVLGMSGLVMGPTASAGPTGHGAALGAATYALWALYALVAGAMLVAWRSLQNHPNPVVNVNLLTSRRFAFASLATLLVCVGMFSAMFFAPLFLEYRQHLGILAAAAMTVPMAVIALVIGILGGWITDRWGVVAPSVTGFVVLALAFVLMARFQPGTPAWLTWMALALAGLGMGLPLAPSTVAAFAATPQGSEGEAAGLFNLAHNLGRPLGLATLGVGLVPAVTATFSHAFALSAVAAALGALASLGMAGGRGSQAAHTEKGAHAA